MRRAHMRAGRGKLRAFVVAAALAGAQAALVAQEGFSKTGGPLWWLPENDGTWSRFHDVWHDSQQVEVAAEGAATSFPEDTWVVTRIKGYATDALPNSACDYQNGEVLRTVGPPLSRDEYPSNARNARTPEGWGGGLGGLQMSVHIGEWWQGLYFRETPGSTYRWPDDWSSLRYGSFRVMTQNDAGVPILAFGPSGPWDSMVPRPGMLLSSPDDDAGGWGCLGNALVMMHGTPHGRGAYPPPITDAAGNRCYSQPRLFVLRANTEARCEPDLSQRYELTEEFWQWFEQQRISAGGARVPPHPVYGDSLPPLFPDRVSAPELLLDPSLGLTAEDLAALEYSGPYPLMRRGEFGLFSVGEFAAADEAIQPVPWATPTYQVGTDAARRNDLARFVDDATRPAPFGGGTMTLRNNTGAAAGIDECLEIAPAGWDAATGTFDPRCPDPWTGANRFTGVVNHENDGQGQTVRPQEVGRRDNREAVGVATIRRLPGAVPDWTPEGFGWFEHKSAPIGCLMLRRILNWDLVGESIDLDYRVEQIGENLGRIYNGPCPSWLPPGACAAYKEAARRRHTEFGRLMFGWRLIAQWRNHTLLSLQDALPDYSGSSGTLFASGRGPGELQNDRCYTGPIGEGSYNERLAATASDHVSATEWMNPAWSGLTYWGSDMQDQAWWSSAGRDHDYHYFAEVRGAVTSLVEADAQARTGEQEPFPLDLGHVYGGPGVRRGAYTFREFACPTADHAGYYGAGVTHMGPQTLGHRDAPAGEAWKTPDPEIDPEDTERNYPSGTPCIDAADSPLSALTGGPLSEYYNVHGTDPATLQRGTERCYEARRPTAAEVADGADPGAWLPVDGSAGQWSNPGRGGLDSRYYLEYSGDPETGPQPAGEPKMRPSSYMFQDDSGVIALVLRERAMSLEFGMPSFDLEREDLSAVWDRAPRVRLQSSESYAGVPPGFCPGGGCGAPPIDWSSVDYDGPIRFFGAGGIGGTGGCVLRLPTGPFDAIDAMVPGQAMDVMASQQSLVCLLPIDSAIARPTGSCPRPGVGE